MIRFKVMLLLWLIFFGRYNLAAQVGESDLRIFGYFQNSFAHQSESLEDPRQNSFNLQQLNLFFQKNLARDWRAFVNFEVLNTFSSSRNWGAFNLEEAWVRYGLNEKFNLKLGLLIPIFNHLNEIKNRTPLLPYVIRPLVYETSFSEFIAVEEFTPARAFVQSYGFFPLNEVKLDYAIYVGNSPNINIDSDEGQTGIDTTATFLVGGRVGLRFYELKIGLSAARDKVNFFRGAEELLQREVPPSRFVEIPRLRLGGDLSYHVDRFSLEGEVIVVSYDDKTPEISLDKEFYYGTLGYRFSEKIFAYGSYWFTAHDVIVLNPFNQSELTMVEFDVKVPTIGIAYTLNDRITFKAQFAMVDVDLRLETPSESLKQKNEFNYYSIAASVFF